jgi:hypothetical protein
MNKNQVHEQLEHYHQLLQIWKKYKANHKLDLFAMVDDVGAPEVSAIDPEGGASASGVDAKGGVQWC